MRIAFTKMQGAGNDFVVLDARAGLALSREQIQRLADRHYGVGCDQVLLLEVPQGREANARFRFINQDGSEAGQCGNGARCLAAFARAVGLVNGRRMRAEIAQGMLEIEWPDATAGEIRVNLGSPLFTPQSLPFDASGLAPQRAAEGGETWSLTLPGGAVAEFFIASLGNPHAVLVVPNAESAPVAQIGSFLQAHARFPQSVNVGFAQILSRSEIALRVFERGAGETLACGSGAAAAAACLMRAGRLSESVRVHARGGDLQIDWAQSTAPLWLSGAAQKVFEGVIEL